MPHQPAARVAAIAAGLVMAALLASDGAAVPGTAVLGSTVPGTTVPGAAVPGSVVDDKPTTGLRLGEVATIRDRFGDVVDVTIGSAQLRTDCVAHGFRILDRQNVYADVTVTVVRGSWTIALANFFLADRPAAPDVWHFGPTGRDCGADLAEGPMEAGATRRGHLALPVLDAPVPSQIAYAAGGTPASWKLGRA